MPNRILKESICTSDSIDSLSWFEEVLYYRLIVNCDDFGRFDGRLAVIKNRLFPLKDNLTLATVSKAINKLASTGLVALYEFEGKPFLYLPTWNEHQQIRAKKSKYPSPDDDTEAKSMHMKSSDIMCNQLQENVPVIQSNPIQYESNNESESESQKTTTTTTTDAHTPPTRVDIYIYFLSELCIDDAAVETQLFQAYNAKRGWDCLPDWKAAADLWAARKEERDRERGKQ